MGRGWKNFEVSLDSDESSEESEEDGRQRCCHLREYIHCHERNDTRNVSIKGTSDQILERLETRRKVIFVIKWWKT